MKKIVLLLLVLCLGGAAQAQETYLFAERDTCSLYLDIYRPTEGSRTQLDSLAKPAIVYVFGGGFTMGERSGAFVRPWFKRLNDNGYTVVTIDYRLGMKDYRMGKGLHGAYKASEQFYASQQMGVEDLFSAVSFLAENRDNLGIDPDRLVVAGSSAGAIIALAAEYDIVCGRTAGLPEGFNFRGVMAFAGAVISLTGAPDYPVAPCPTLLLHGTSDEAVAYKRYGALGRGIWGSDFLSDQWDDKGYKGWCIYRFQDRTHDVAAYMDYLWDIEEAFLEKNVIRKNVRTIDAVVDDSSLPSWGNISMDNIYRP